MNRIIFINDSRRKLRATTLKALIIYNITEAAQYISDTLLKEDRRGSPLI